MFDEVCDIILSSMGLHQPPLKTLLSNALWAWILQGWQVNRNPMQRDGVEEEKAADPCVTCEYFKFLPRKAKNTSL